MLKDLALAAKVDAHALKVADDVDDVKAEVIRLILEAKGRGKPSATPPQKVPESSRQRTQLGRTRRRARTAIRTARAATATRMVTRMATTAMTARTQAAAMRVTIVTTAVTTTLLRKAGRRRRATA